MKRISEITIIAVLLIAAMAKLVTAGIENPSLGIPDNVIPFLSARQLLIAVGVLEIIVICILLLQNHKGVIIGALTLLTVGFISYRLVLWIGHFHKTCGCLGYWYKALGISAGQAEKYNTFLFGLFICAVALYIYQWFVCNRLRDRIAPGSGTLRGSSS